MSPETRFFEVEALDPETGNSTFVTVNAATAIEAETYARFHHFTTHLVEATPIHPPEETNHV